MREERVAEIARREAKKEMSFLKDKGGGSPPVGYSPLESIRGALFHWVAVPFNGSEVWCQLRCPNATQIEQCGDISSIDIKDGKESAGYTQDEIIALRNYQEKLCRLALNQPTFDRIASLVGEADFVLSEKREALKLLRARFEQGMGEMSEAEKKESADEISALEIDLGFVLPDDAMAFLAAWAMGSDVSDVKKVSKESLLKAASLAKAHGKAPSDYLSGVYTDHNKADIDHRAFVLLADFLREQEAARAGNRRWVLGGRKKPSAGRRG